MSFRQSPSFLQRLPRLVRAVGLLFFVGSFAGCGPEVGDRLPLSGSVKWKGQPLDTGTIDFVSADQQNRTGSVITRGSYKIPAEHGLPPGKYSVIISSISDSGAASDAPPGPEAETQEGTERLPAEYNVNTQQSAEVVKGGKNQFVFDIP